MKTMNIHAAITVEMSRNMLNYALWLLLGFFLKNCVLSLTWTKVVQKLSLLFFKVILYFFPKKFRFLISKAVNYIVYQ